VPSAASPPPAGTYSRPLGMAVREPAARKDQGYLRTFVDTATTCTPENELKHTSWPWSKAAGTRAPARTSNAGRPKARPDSKRCAASSDC